MTSLFDKNIQYCEDQNQYQDQNPVEENIVEKAGVWNYITSWTSYVGNTIDSIIKYGEYPKEHVEPHKLPKIRKSVCDYSGNYEDCVYVKYLPYDIRYGIIYSAKMAYSARSDCCNFCEKNHIYPISFDFLSNNDYHGPYFVKSGDCKNYRIVPKTTTIVKDNLIMIGVTNRDGYDGAEYVSLKLLCDLNNIDYKKMCKSLERELKLLYNIQTNDIV